MYIVFGDQCYWYALPGKLPLPQVPAGAKYVGQTVIRGRTCDQWSFVVQAPADTMDLYDIPTIPFASMARVVSDMRSEGVRSQIDYITFNYVKQISPDQLIPSKALLDKCIFVPSWAEGHIASALQRFMFPARWPQ